MANITIGQVGACLALLVGIFSAVEFMYGRLRKWFEGVIKSELEPMREAMKKDRETFEALDVAQNKNFLIRCFDDLENGRQLSATTSLRMHEAFDHYTEDLGQNSYIHEEWEKLKQEGKL